MRQSTGVHDFEANRAVVDHTIVTREARGTLGLQAHRVERRRKGGKRRLHLHLHGEGVLLRLVELHIQTAIACLRHRLHFPFQHLLAQHTRNFSFARQQQDDMGQFALHHAALDERELTHQSGRDGNLREHFRRVEQLALALGPRSFPGELHSAVGGEKRDELRTFALRFRTARETKLRVCRQSLQRERL